MNMVCQYMVNKRFWYLIALVIVITLGVSNTNRIFRRSFIPMKQSISTKKSLKELREESWPYVPADLSDDNFQTLLSRLEKASYEKKYILRFKKARKDDIGPMKWCGNCEITFDPAMIDHPQTKAVVVDFDQFHKVSSPTLTRRSDQFYVWFSLESPDALGGARHMTLLSETKFKFNLTQTYRRDSGIYKPYRRISDVLQDKWKRGIHKNISTILDGKTRIAASVISNCRGTSGAASRLRLITKLKSLGLEVDTFGKCFDKPVKARGEEFDNKLKKYKFYLSFENAFHCRDYITEKFLRYGHDVGTIPVVLGATKAEYEAVAPKGSFIFVEDFESASSLVDYLHYLDKNDDEYLKYFRWIEKGRSAMPEPRGAFHFCQLCRMLHGINIDKTDPNHEKTAPSIGLFTDDVKPRMVENLREWFYATESKECFRKDVEVVTRML